MTPVAPTLQVPVEGGALVAHDLTPDVPDDAPCAVAVHGITANGLSWGRVAEVLGRSAAGTPVRVLALDLRGRAASRDVGPPYGVGTHADDVRAVVASLPGRPVLLGHSMGGFVCALAAARGPEDVAGVVLVDGGLAFNPPADLDVDAALTAILGPAMQRLSISFPDREAYLRFWTDHPAVGPALAGPAGDVLREYLLHDLVPGDTGEYVSSCVVEAVRADGADVLADRETLDAVSVAAEAGVPIEFVWAGRGLQDEPQGLYDEDRLAALEVPEGVRVTGVPDVNHYSVILEGASVDVIADAVRHVLEVGDDGR